MHLDLGNNANAIDVRGGVAGHATCYSTAGGLGRLILSYLFRKGTGGVTDTTAANVVALNVRVGPTASTRIGLPIMTDLTNGGVTDQVLSISSGTRFLPIWPSMTTQQDGAASPLGGYTRYVFPDNTFRIMLRSYYPGGGGFDSVLDVDAMTIDLVQ